MREPYVKVPLSIITADLKPQSKVLLAYMINFKNMNGEKPICKSARELGEAVKMPSTTVKRSLAELESRGLIKVQKGHTSSYIVRSNMDQSQSNMDQSQSNMDQSWSNMDQSQSNMDRISPNRTDPIHLYIKENKKKYKNEVVKARAREQLTYDDDLFVKKKAEGGNK